MFRRIIARFAVAAAIICLSGAHIPVVAQQVQGRFTPEQYQKALWMVTRFYGAQRQGEGPNWLLMDHTRPTTRPDYISEAAFAALTNDMMRVSYVKDALDGRDLSGGWFDCGDFVLFGQTFFFSAYMLALAYETFPTGFHDLYHGDYRDYAESGNWSITGGRPNRIPDLLEELKYATDWIIKATPNASDFYYQKGHGGAGSGGDHALWTTSGIRSAVAVERGGELERSRAIYKNPNDGVMASFAAAALAVMSRIYRKYDDAYADLCVVHARNAYAYARQNRDRTAGSAGGGHYPPHKDPRTVFVTAASEMYMTTSEASFRSDIAESEIKTSWHVLDYSNSHDLTAYAAARALPDRRETHLKFLLDEFVTKYVREVNSEGVSNLGGGWGQLRYAGNTAFVAALYSAATGTTQYDQFIYNQIDYILGANSGNVSFLTGFCEGCTRQVQMPHHRNVFLRDDNPSDNAKEQMRIPERNKYFGYLVGGRRVPSQFQESISDYQMSEGGIDYNAGLLGALAYVVSRRIPADTSRFGITDTIPNSVVTPSRNAAMARSGYTVNVVPGSVVFSAQDGLSITNLSVYNIQGRKVYSRSGAHNQITWNTSARARGMYLYRITLNNGAVVQRNVMLR